MLPVCSQDLNGVSAHLNQQLLHDAPAQAPGLGTQQQATSPDTGSRSMPVSWRRRLSAHLDQQPVHAAPAQALGLRIQQQAPAHVRPLRLQVRVDGVGAPPEVQVLREVEGGLVLQQGTSASAPERMADIGLCAVDLGPWWLVLWPVGHPGVRVLREGKAQPAAGGVSACVAMAV